MTITNTICRTIDQLLIAIDNINNLKLHIVLIALKNYKMLCYYVQVISIGGGGGLAPVKLIKVDFL